MDLPRGDTGKLRAPAAHVGAIRVKAAPLQDGIEHAEERLRIRARTRHPLPAAVIVGEVAIQEAIDEDPLPRLPVESEVLGKEACDDQPRAVWQPGLLRQLAHGGVDDQVAGPAVAPGEEGR